MLMPAKETQHKILIKMMSIVSKQICDIEQCFRCIEIGKKMELDNWFNNFLDKSTNYFYLDTRPRGSDRSDCVYRVCKSFVHANYYHLK